MLHRIVTLFNLSIICYNVDNYLALQDNQYKRIYKLAYISAYIDYPIRRIAATTKAKRRELAGQTEKRIILYGA